MAFLRRLHARHQTKLDMTKFVSILPEIEAKHSCTAFKHTRQTSPTAYHFIYILRLVWQYLYNSVCNSFTKFSEKIACDHEVVPNMHICILATSASRHWPIRRSMHYRSIMDRVNEFSLYKHKNLAALS